MSIHLGGRGPGHIARVQGNRTDWIFTNGALDSRITFTRAGNTATRTNAAGVIEAVAADTARFDYDPVTLAPKGFVAEPAATQLLLNSLIDGTNLSTQGVTVTAAAHTISFYGTGSITLTGAHSATVSGTGAYPTRKTLTFTPSAGSLTCTVSGTVQYAQLETGSVATSFIPSAGAAVLRNADVPLMSGANFSSWFNPTEGTFVFEGDLALISSANSLLAVSDGTSNNRMVSNASGTNAFVVTVGGVSQAGLITGNPTANTVFKRALAYKLDDFAVCLNGGTVQTDTSAAVPTVDRMYLGANQTGGAAMIGHIRRLTYYPQRLTNANLQSLTA